MSKDRQRQQELEKRAAALKANMAKRKDQARAKAAQDVKTSG